MIKFTKTHVIALMNETAVERDFDARADLIHNLCYLIADFPNSIHLEIKKCKGCSRSTIEPFHHVSDMVDDDLCRDCDKHMGDVDDNQFKHFND